MYVLALLSIYIYTHGKDTCNVYIIQYVSYMYVHKRINIWMNKKKKKMRKEEEKKSYMYMHIHI